MALKHALDDPADQIRGLALEALGQLGEPAIGVLIDWVRKSRDLSSQYLYDYFWHHRDYVKNFVTPEEFAPTLLMLLNCDQPYMLAQGAFLATVFPVDPRNGTVIKRLWECLFCEGENPKRFAVLALNAVSACNA